MDDVTQPGSASTKRPVALIVALVLAILAAGAVGAYAQWLAQERAHLQTQLASQERKVLDLREQLTRAEVAVQEKDAALASREVALADATQPELPVRVSFRPAWMGQGMVASFRNVGTQQLTLMVEFRDPNLRSSRDFAIVVEGGATAEVGHPQGWLVNSGQSVRVSASGFKSVTAFAP
jgi:type II secretory pathway pseudopilin PulG